MKYYNLDVLYGTKLNEVIDTLQAAKVEVKVIDEHGGYVACKWVEDHKVAEVEDRLRALEVEYNWWE